MTKLSEAVAEERHERHEEARGTQAVAYPLLDPSLSTAHSSQPGSPALLAEMKDPEERPRGPQAADQTGAPGQGSEVPPRPSCKCPRLVTGKRRNRKTNRKSRERKTSKETSLTTQGAAVLHRDVPAAGAQGRPCWDQRTSDQGQRHKG